MQDIIINFSVNDQDLKTSLATLVQLGKITQADADAFLKLSAASKKAGEDVSTSTKKASNSVSDLSKALKEIGATIGIAFGVQQVIAFGEKAVNAYAKAQKAQQQLLFALNNQKDVQQRLIAQADKLQESLGVDDDVIVQQQAFLAIQGRTEQQIKKTINAALELAEAKGIDLNSAVQMLDKTFEGEIGRLGTLDKDFGKLSATQLENGAAIDLVNEKFNGFAKAGAQSVAGQLAIQQRRVEDLTKALGEKLAPSWVQVKVSTLEGVQGIIDAISGLVDKNRSILNPANWFGANAEANRRERFDALVKEQTDNALEYLQDFNKRKLANIILGNLEELKANKNLSEAQKANLQGEINAASQLLKIKKDSAETDAKQIENVDRLRKKLEDLQKRQGSVSTISEGEKIAKQIAETQKKIDDLTGKTAEKNAEAEKKREEERQKNKEQRLKEYYDLLAALRNENAKIEIDTIADLEQKERMRYEDAKRQLDEKYKYQLGKTEEYQKAVELLEKEHSKNITEIRTASLKEWSKGGMKTPLEMVREQIDKDIEKLQQLGEAIQGVGELYNAFGQRSVRDAEERRDKTLEADQQEIDSLKNKYEQGKISKRSYEAELKKLEDKKAADQKKLDAEIAEQKRKQAIANRVLALFNIAIHTAESIMKTTAELGIFGLPIIPTLIGLGVVQAAAVLAQPLPKFHKGRLAQGNGMEEMAIIRKDETIFNPQQSKEYAPTFSAIYHGKIKPGIINDYVNLTLKGKSNTGLDTSKLAYDIAYALRDQNKVIVKNMPDLAKAIADNLPKPDPRKW